MVENGGIPIKYKLGGGKPEIVSIPKDVYMQIIFFNFILYKD